MPGSGDNEPFVSHTTADPSDPSGSKDGGRPKLLRTRIEAP